MVEDDDIVKKLLVLLILIGIGLVAGAYWLNSGPKTVPESQFTFQRIERGTLRDSVSATGVIQPSQLGAVGSDLPGQVASIDPKADFNRPVKKGQPLAYLDKKLFVEKLAQAKTAIDAAKADVEKANSFRFAAELKVKRLKDLIEKGGFQKDLDQAEAELKATEAAVGAAKAMVKKAEAARDEAQTGLDKTVLASPIDGIIIDKKIVLGQAVSPMLATPLFTIASDLKHMEVHAQVTEGDVGKVRKGLKAKFTVNAYPEESFYGTVREIRLMPINVQGAVFYTAIIEVENTWDKEANDWRLRPGMPSSVDLIRREHTDVWKVPTAAISFRLDPAYMTPAAKNKQAQWQSKVATADWHEVWILGPDQKPWPIFVRMGGENSIQDSQYVEVVEWDPELQLDPKKPETWPRLIINAPPVGKSWTDVNVRVF